MSRTETDSLGTIEVPGDAHWGAQTQRSLEDFAIGGQHVLLAVIHALALVKKAAIQVSNHLGELPPEVTRLIEQAADGVLVDRHDEHLPLVVWQTSNGIQTNMNINEVIVGRANELAGNPHGDKSPVHPDDHVNRAQSSNDSFPTAMHIAAAKVVYEQLLPAIVELSDGLAEQSARHASLVKTRRTHLMDATPIAFGQELSAFVAQLDYVGRVIHVALPAVYQLAQGGITVGTGFNALGGFVGAITAEIAAGSGLPFVVMPNKSAALAGRGSLVILPDALKSLAVAPMKTANGLCLLGSGPRADFAEVRLSANEPDGSIIPNKVNPTQCEALSMLACQIMGNDSTIFFAASQGRLQLSVFKLVIVHNLLEFIRLLTDGCRNFNKHCVADLESDIQRITNLLERDLMLVTVSNSRIGYDKAAEIAKKAYAEDATLRAAAPQLGYLDEAQLDRWVRPEQMLGAGRHG